MFQITILFLYLLAALGFAYGKLQPESRRSALFLAAAFVLALNGIVIHGISIFQSVTYGDSINVSLATSVSLIGFQLAVIGTIAALDTDLRGVSAGLLLLAAPTGLSATLIPTIESSGGLSWQLQTHVFSALFAYGLLATGAIIAVYALIQDRRLRAAKLSRASNLFAPLETTERVLHGVTSTGIAVLAMSVILGITFVENLFTQSLVHKFVLSILALVVFGILLLGRHLWGWRGQRAIYLYLGGFALLCLAYFGSRIILELVLGRSWG